VVVVEWEWDRDRIAGITISLGIFGVPLLLLGWCSFENDRLEKGLQDVRPGMRLDQVVEIMGSPSWSGRCFDPKYNVYSPLNAGCTKELGYYGALRGLPDGHYYVVWFNADDKVIESTKISSP